LTQVLIISGTVQDGLRICLCTIAFKDAVSEVMPNISKIVVSDDLTVIVKCTQAEYDALSSVDENTLYIIVG
jgi:hypothetical protein